MSDRKCPRQQSLQKVCVQSIVVIALGSTSEQQISQGTSPALLLLLPAGRPPVDWLATAAERVRMRVTGAAVAAAAAAVGADCCCGGGSGSCLLCTTPAWAQM
jgi:hypothetical protein